MPNVQVSTPVVLQSVELSPVAISGNADDLINGTTGTGEVVLATSPTLTTPDFTGSTPPTWSGLSMLFPGSVVMLPAVGQAISAPWLVFDPFGVPVSTAGTASQGFQEAIDHAINNGYPLHVFGHGTNISAQLPIYLNITSTVNVPACQVQEVTLHNVTLNIVAGDGLVFDSCETMFWTHTGQLIYSGNGNAIHFLPQNPTPADRVYGITASRFFFPGIAAVAGTNPNCVNFDLAHASILDSEFHFGEINGLNPSSTAVVAPTIIVVCNALASGGAGGGGPTVFENNSIYVFSELHGYSSAGVQVGIDTINQGNYRRNRWYINAMKPFGTSAVGISTFGTEDQFYFGTIDNEEVSGGGQIAHGIEIQTGAIGNLFFGSISGTSGEAVLDGQPGNNDTVYFVNGTFFIGGTLILMGGNLNIGSFTPASSSATGVAGTISADANYVYVCTATNTWKRVALSSF